jgi:hypothetical protein
MAATGQSIGLRRQLPASDALRELCPPGGGVAGVRGCPVFSRTPPSNLCLMDLARMGWEVHAIARNLIMDLGEQAHQLKFMILHRGSNFTATIDANPMPDRYRALQRADAPHET